MAMDGAEHNYNTDTDPADMVVMSAEDAMRAMQAGRVPARLRVEGDLRFYQHDKVVPPRALPAEELVAGSIIIHDASHLTGWPRVVRCSQLYLWKFPLDIPHDAQLEIIAPIGEQQWGVGDISLRDCWGITRLPELLGQLHELQLWSCARLAALPDECIIREALDLFDCASLTRLPDTIDAMRLNIGNCGRLMSLPQHLRSLYINMNGCAGITRWDDPNVTTLRQLSARGCVNLESLPPNLRQIDELDVSGCGKLTHLPESLRITRWVDVGESGVRALPASARGVQVRWNGVNVTGQVAFHPETLMAHQALNEGNAELRRIMLERISPERFITEAQPQQLDADTDRGGARRLLAVIIFGHEPLVMLEVRDPSTGRVYLLRVPPEMNTCRQAAAWVAGFDDPDDYHPVMET